MTLKLSEIFIPLPGVYTYPTEELYALKIHPGFVEKIACHFKLAYVDKSGVESNLCFVNNKEVRAEYKTSFSKEDVLHIIFSQFPGKTVDMRREEVIFPDNFFY